MLKRLNPALVAAAFVATAFFHGPAPVRAAAVCPEGGTIRFGVEPFEAGAIITPTYEALGKLISEKTGCPVQVFVATSYNAEIEAMRAGKLDLGEFGPLGYVFAHQLAKADVFASYADKAGKPTTYLASIVTYQGSGIKTIKDVAGHSFAYSDPSSTSGHLYPAYGLKKNGIDPDKGIQPVYAGTHTASWEALRNHKVDAGELNSNQKQAAIDAGSYNASDIVQLWLSNPIPEDPIAIRSDLPPAVKKAIMDAVLSVDLSSLGPDLLKHLEVKNATKIVSQQDAAYDTVRDLVKTMNYQLPS